MTLIYSIILLLTFVSCCKSYKTGISPDVRIVINKGINEYIYSEGLKQLPKYYDLIIAHTSFLIDKDKIEDDRLCAINVKNGKVEWYFPKNTDIHCGYSFGGTSYQYRNNIIFKYIKDDSDKKSHNLACINIDTGEILWERSEIINNYHSYADVHGWNNFVYFTENSNKIYRFNIETKDVSLVYTANDAEICHFKIDNNYLLFFEDRRIILSDDYMDYYYQNEAIILDIETGEEVFRYRIEPNMGRYIGNGIIQDGILYANVDTYITAVDIKTGQQLWERDDPEAYILEDLIVYNGVVLKCGGNSTYGYNAQTGELLYKYDCFGSHYTTRNGKYAYMCVIRTMVGQ